MKKLTKDLANHEKIGTRPTPIDRHDENSSPLERILFETDEPSIRWPLLEDLGLNHEQRAARHHGIGGSDANIILSGDPHRVRDLWLEKRGEKPCDDLSEVLRVVLGAWTEPFNRQWYERVSGHRVSQIGRVMVCNNPQWRRCTLDGMVLARNAIWEAKHTSPFNNVDQVLDRYMPQLQHNMAVAGLSTAILSIIFGNHKFEIVEVASDWLYQLELLEAEADFWEAVVTGREPTATSVPPAPRAIGTREVCLEGNNAWASAAVDWLENRFAAKCHANASATIRSLVQEDVARAFGHGIEAKRSKSGAITIREVA